MKKKPIFTLLFAIVSLGVLLFILSESLRHMEKRAAETYLKSIQNEFSEDSREVIIDEVECSRFFGRVCSLEKIRIIDGETQIELRNIKIQITNISYNKIGVHFSADSIWHNMFDNPYAIFFPQKFTYTLELKKQDSALGYIVLDRAIFLDFDKFSVNAHLDILLRGKAFANKNILFLAKEWFDASTPSFYEYSLSNLNVEIKANEIGEHYAKHFERANISLKSAINDFKDSFKQNNITSALATSYFNGFVESFYGLLNGKINEIDLLIRRKNDDLVFFDKLDDEAARKKTLEIARILNSISAAHQIELNMESAP